MLKEQDTELYGEARRIFGKREMLWNIQRQIYAAKQKGKTINEEWLIKILNSIEHNQRLEEENWDIKKAIESILEKDMLEDSKLLQARLVIKE